MPESPRFLTLTDVAEVLNTSHAQVYALVRRGELPAIRLGGRGQWRVEASRLEDWIAGQYDATETYVDAHPFSAADQEPQSGHLESGYLESGQQESGQSSGADPSDRGVTPPSSRA